MAIGGADPYTQLYLLRNHSILSATYPVEWSEPISIPKKKKKKPHKSKYSKSENSSIYLLSLLF